jgi:2-dehydro-3-deoxygalactonokinase
MRGEEIQIAGALLDNPRWAARSCIVLPGTHSKWAHIEDGRILRFSTHMTGELFSVLCRHSILGRLLPEIQEAERKPDFAAFELGLATSQGSRPGDFSHQIFAARTLGLTGRLPPSSLADYLSGLLIGHEMVSGLADAQDLAVVPLLLIGEPALCRLYARALSFMRQTTAAILENTAPAGLWDFGGAAIFSKKATSEPD